MSALRGLRISTCHVRIARDLTEFGGTRFITRLGPVKGSNAAENLILGSKRQIGSVSRRTVRAVCSMTVDHTSQSNINEIATVSAHYDLKVDFGEKRIFGNAKIHLQAKTDGVETLRFDTRDLTVEHALIGGQNASYDLGNAHKVLGSALTLDFDEALKKGDEIEVEIRFATSPESTALQWLEPSQTAGKKLPYLFSQCQAIHARSFVPCQDSPSIKFTYTASVSVPKEMRVVMSANLDTLEGKPDESAPSERQVYNFHQNVPMPSYLLAIACGDLDYRKVGPRSKVWSEPSQVDTAAYEFQETDEFLKAAESIAGEYVWGNYDLLLLPPSFPYGGMENPVTTFVTPTLIAGDRSLVNVVAHEIAHSWTGNLVSNETWQDFWLNEGWTVFMERRILGRLKGDATEEFHASQGYLDLQDAVDDFGADHPFTQLVPDLSGGLDPDDAFSKVPYERGFYFLTYLQSLVGKDSFESFLRSYLQNFRFQTINSQKFKDFFLTHYADNKAVQAVDWQTWYFGRGMPPKVISYDAELAREAYQLAEAWHHADVMGIGISEAPKSVQEKDLSQWAPDQVIAFLEKLGQLRSLQAMNKKTTRLMNELYQFDRSQNSEIKLSWYRLCIKAGDEAVFPGVVDFLKSQGRMKYIRPLYKALYQSQAGKRTALNTFKAHRQMYHPVAAKMVATDLEL